MTLILTFYLLLLIYTIRVVNNSSTLIDLAFVSVPGLVQLCETLPPLANSDHLGIHLNLSAKVCKSASKQQLRRIWRYNYADFDKATELLDEIEWEMLLKEATSCTSVVGFRRHLKQSDFYS